MTELPPRYRLVVYDLDGTLIDSRLDLAHAVNATLADQGRPPLAHERIYSYVGDGAPVLIRRALGPEASEAAVAAGLAYFLAYYSDHKLDYTTLYPGVREALDALRDAGVQQAVLTNKPVRISTAILDELGLGSHFARVYGGNSFPTKKPDPAGLLTLLTECGVGAPEALMVGDSQVDVLTARNAGVACCGVTFGFQPETLVAHPPDVLIGEVGQLMRVVLG